MSAVQYIFFDAGFTLLEPYPSVGHHYSKAAFDFGLSVDHEALTKAFIPSWKSVRAKREQAGVLPYGSNLEEARDFWAEVLITTFELAGCTERLPKDLLGRLFDEFAQGDHWRTYPDVIPTLGYLKEQNVKMGVISNWDPRLHQILEELELKQYFDAVVVSSEVGYEKPHKRIFEEARERIGAKESDSFGFIGDEHKADGEGPRNMGWGYSLILRGKAPMEEYNSRSNLLECAQFLLSNEGLS